MRGKLNVCFLSNIWENCDLFSDLDSGGAVAVAAGALIMPENPAFSYRRLLTQALEIHTCL